MQAFGRFNLKTLFLITTIVAFLCCFYNIYSSCKDTYDHYTWKLSKIETLHISHNLTSAYVECRETITHPHMEYVSYNGKILKCNDGWTMHNEYFFLDIIELPSFKVHSHCQHAILGKSKEMIKPGQYYKSHTVIESL